MVFGEKCRTFSGHDDGVSALVVAADGRQILSGGNDGTLRLWELATGKLRYTYRAGLAAGRASDFETLERKVREIPDPFLRQAALMKLQGYTSREIAASLGCSVRSLELKWRMLRQRWGLAIGELSPATHNSRVTAVAMATDTRQAVAASRDGNLRFYDAATGELLRSFAGLETAATAITVAPDGRHALSGSYDFTLKLWDLSTGHSLRSFTGHDGIIERGGDHRRRPGSRSPAHTIGLSRCGTWGPAACDSRSRAMRPR